MKSHDLEVYTVSGSKPNQTMYNNLPESKPVFWKFLGVDDFEVHPCAVVDFHEDGGEIVEQTSHGDPEIQFWTVYMHYGTPSPYVGIDAVTDVPTQSLAEEIARKLRLEL